MEHGRLEIENIEEKNWAFRLKWLWRFGKEGEKHRG